MTAEQMINDKTEMYMTRTSTDVRFRFIKTLRCSRLSRDPAISSAAAPQQVQNIYIPNNNDNTIIQKSDSTVNIDRSRGGSPA